MQLLLSLFPSSSHLSGWFEHDAAVFLEEVAVKGEGWVFLFGFLFWLEKEEKEMGAWKQSRRISSALKTVPEERVCDFREGALIPVKGRAGADMTANT